MFQKILLAVLFTCIAFSGDQAQGDDYVRGYYRSNGTYVAPHYRSSRDGNFSNNWSTYPNINPYTGQMGSRISPYSPRISGPSLDYPSYRSSSSSYRWSR